MLRAFSATLMSAALVLSVPAWAFAQTMSPEDQAKLEQQLQQVEAEIKQNQEQLAAKQKERTSLERDVAIMDAKIQASQLAIKERDLMLQRIKGDITQKALGIQSLDSKTASGQQSLAQMLRETRMIDDLSPVELFLGAGLTGYFQEMDGFQTIQRALGSSFNKIATTRSDLVSRKQALEDQQQEENDLLQLQVLQKQSLTETEKQKQTLVKSAKGQESVYQKVIADKQQTAAQIRAALFALRDTTQEVSFGDMFTYAKEASVKTGVRPAVILGILSEESNLGQNVGTGNWKVDMHPTRDVPVFKTLCAQLGLDPDKMPVSKKPWYGWGGAMGPAQFIPSTWVQYADRIAAITGHNPPNPWDPRTAVFATALLMADNGADQQTPQAERLAALRYLAGWKNATKSAYAFYGDDVMELAAKFQGQIDVLAGS
jgi:membrane-bound lytic murein transglycosylase B